MTGLRRSVPRSLGAIAIAWAAFVGSACHASDGSTGGCPTPQAGAIDAPTMAFLSIARALHHEADMGEARGDAQGAISALERLVATPAPKATEVEEVLADAHARLAELRLKGGDIDGAGRDVHAGLQHAREPTYFRGHLLEVEGLLEEARAAALADAGRADEARRTRAKAMDLLEEAVRTQQQVIERALADGGGDA